jgi:hypothetical protein
MTSVQRFIRLARPADLEEHFRRMHVAVPCPEHPRDDPEKRFFNAIDDMTDEQRDHFVTEVERISEMADEVGHAAMLSLKAWRGPLEHIDGGVARAHWLYLRSEEAFRQAEEVRFAEQYQNAVRLWDAFEGPRNTAVSDYAEKLEAFRDAVADILDAKRVHLERIERTRSRTAGTSDAVQVTIFNEDVPEDELVFTERGVENRPRRHVREHAVVYEPETGTIEVVGRNKQARAEIASCFAELLLGVAISDKPLPPRRFELAPLLRPGPLVVDPALGIERAKVTRIAMTNLDKTLVQRFEVPFDDGGTIHDTLDGEYGDENPLKSSSRPCAAHIDVRFVPKNGRRRGKKVGVDLTMPNRCSLRGKTEQERIVLDQCIKAWGLERGADA